MSQDLTVLVAQLNACAANMTDLNRRAERLLRFHSIVDLMREQLSEEDEDIRNRVGDSELEVLFECLRADESEVSELARDALLKLTRIIRPCHFIQRYLLEIHKCLKSENPNMVTADTKITGLLLLQSVAGQGAFKEHYSCWYNGFLISAIATLGDDELSVAKETMKFLYMIGEHPVDLKSLLAGQPLQKLQNIVRTGADIVQMRLFEVMVDLCKRSEAHFRLVVEYEFLPSLIKAVLNDTDVLLQLSALDIVIDLATVEYGLNYLDEQGLLTALDEMAEATQRRYMGSVLTPGLVRMFGTIAKMHTRVDLERFRHLVGILFDFLSQYEETQNCLLALETVGFLCQNVQKKLDIFNRENVIEKVVQPLQIFIVGSTIDLKTRCLAVFKDIIKVHPEEGNATVEADMNEKFYNAFQTRPLDFLVNLCKQPIAEVSIAAYDIVYQISNQDWGLTRINNQPGLMEYLLDRSTPVPKEAAEFKYEILKNCNSKPSYFSPDIQRKVSMYVSQGVFYREYEPQVEYANV